MRNKAKGPKARTQAIEACFEAFPAEAVGLANLVRSFRQPTSSTATTLTALARHHERVVEIFRLAGFEGWWRGTPVALTPFVLAGYYAGQMLEVVARPPHAATHEFRMHYLRGRGVLDQDHWGRLARRVLKPREVRAWTLNSGAAASMLERLAHTAPACLSLVRRCRNRRCEGTYFLRRSGPTEPRFCRRPACRAHRRRTSSNA